MNTEKCKLVHFAVDTHARIDGKLYLYFQNGGIVFEDELGDTYELHLKSQSLHEVEINFKKFPFTPNDLMLQFCSGSVGRSVAFRVMLQVDGFAAAIDAYIAKTRTASESTEILKSLWLAKNRGLRCRTITKTSLVDAVDEQMDEACLKAFYAGTDAGIEVKDETQALIEEIEYETLLNRALDTNDRELFASLAFLVPEN